GSGAVLAVIQGKTVEVLRYSNARQRQFGKVARYIKELKRFERDREKAARGEKDDAGKPIEVPKEAPRLEPDKEDQQRCPNCQLLLPEGTQVCPACMSKGK